MDGFVIACACIIVVLIAFSAFLSLSVAAFSGSNRAKLKKMAGDGDAKAERAIGLLEDYDRLLSTGLVCTRMVNVVFVTVAAVLFVGAIGRTPGIIVNIIVMLLVLVTICEIVPRSVAGKDPERWCTTTCGAFGTVMKVMSPLSWLFSGLTKAIGNENSIDDEELEAIVDECEDGGILKDTESELIKSAIRFDDVQVSEVCIPRINVTAVPRSASPDELADVISESGFSRIPVYDKTIDDITGVVYSKEFFTRRHKGEPCAIDDVMKPIKYVPETMSTSDLLNDFQRTKVHMAVVLDSYGGTVGIVTLEDVLEVLVGEIWDESDVVHEDIVPNVDDSLTVKGSADIHDVMDMLGREIDLNGYEENTVNGLIMFVLDRAPVTGDEVTVDDVSFRVLSVEGHGAEECRVMDHRAPPEEQP